MAMLEYLASNTYEMSLPYKTFMQVLRQRRVDPSSLPANNIARAAAQFQRQTVSIDDPTWRDEDYARLVEKNSFSVDPAEFVVNTLGMIAATRSLFYGEDQPLSDPRWRDVFLLRYYLDYTPTHIAGMYNISTTMVQRILHKALAKVKEAAAEGDLDAFIRQRSA